MKYPCWLNIASCLALASVAVGIIDITLGYWFGAIISALGWVGVWVAGTIAERIAANRR